MSALRKVDAATQRVPFAHLGADVIHLDQYRATMRGKLACPGCGDGVHFVSAANNGRAAHFAHNPREGSSGCSWESLAHALLKERLTAVLNGGGMVPRMFASGDYPWSDRGAVAGLAETERTVEVAGYRARADVLFTPADTRLCPLLCEVVVNHAVPPEKTAAVIQHGWQVVTITISKPDYFAIMEMAGEGVEDIRARATDYIMGGNMHVLRPSKRPVLSPAEVMRVPDSISFPCAARTALRPSFGMTCEACAGQVFWKPYFPAADHPEADWQCEACLPPAPTMPRYQARTGER